VVVSKREASAAVAEAVDTKKAATIAVAVVVATTGIINLTKRYISFEILLFKEGFFYFIKYYQRKYRFK
jgi:hypothetical protein